MTVRELIRELEEMNPDSTVFMGYDSNVVVTEPFSVVAPTEEELEDACCWWGVNLGDVVILCDE